MSFNRISARRIFVHQFQTLFHRRQQSERRDTPPEMPWIDQDVVRARRYREEIWVGAGKSHQDQIGQCGEGQQVWIPASGLGVENVIGSIAGRPDRLHVK
jgi:hypothetical protein